MSQTSTSPNIFTKDPDAVLDYELDWSDWLVEDDTIATSTWIVPTEGALHKDSDTHSGTSTTVWFSAGEENAQVAVVNRVTTTQGRTDDRTIYFNILER